MFFGFILLKIFGGSSKYNQSNVQSWKKIRYPEETSVSVSLCIGTEYAVALDSNFTGYPVDNPYSRYGFPVDIHWINLCSLRLSHKITI